MTTSLRILIVEDSAFDAQIVVNLLRKGGYDPIFQRVETDSEMRAALAQGTWDVVLSDYNLPQFSAPLALKVLQESGLDLPFIIISGGIGEDIAVEAMKSGAHDYLMKGNLQRLVPAVQRELREAANRTAQREAKKALLESETRYRLLWETCPDAVILMDPHNRILFANPATRVVFGYAPEELVGQNLTMLQPPSLRLSHEQAMKRFLGTGIKKLNWRASETLGLRKDGAQVPIEMSFTNMELSGETRFVAFIRDVTERKRAERELRDNQEQFRVAREIQQRLFPKGPPTLPSFDVAGSSFPAEATGGDYFDYLPMLNGRLGLIVGDVTGHGVGPALLMAETRAYLRVLTGRREDVGEILGRANRVLAGDVGAERFVTMFFGRLDPARRSLAYASAGHPSGYILGSDGRVKRTLPRTGPPLGIQPESQYVSSAELRLTAGDLLLVATDGIEEAMSAGDELFGAERMLEVVRANQTKSAQEIVQALHEAVRQFIGAEGQTDDVTALIVKVLRPSKGGGTASPNPR